MYNTNPEKLKEYQISLKIMKDNISRVIAITLFVISFVVFLSLLCVFIDEILYLIYEWLDISNDIFYILGFVIKVLCILLQIIFLALPLQLGINKWFYHISTSQFKNVKPDILFYYFNNKYLYTKALKLQLKLILKKTKSIIIYLIPAFVVGLLNIVFDIELELFGIDTIEFLFIVLILIGLSASFIHNLKYFMVKYLLFNNNKLKINEIFIYSDWIMLVRKKEVLERYISFLPFYILSLLIIPIFFLSPYMSLYFIQVSKKFMDEYT